MNMFDFWGRCKVQAQRPQAAHVDYQLVGQRAGSCSPWHSRLVHILHAADHDVLMCCVCIMGVPFIMGSQARPSSRAQRQRARMLSWQQHARSSRARAQSSRRSSSSDQRARIRRGWYLRWFLERFLVTRAHGVTRLLRRLRARCMLSA